MTVIGYVIVARLGDQSQIARLTGAKLRHPDADEACTEQHEAQEVECEQKRVDHLRAKLGVGFLSGRSVNGTPLAIATSDNERVD